MKRRSVLNQQSVQRQKRRRSGILGILRGMVSVLFKLVVVSSVMALISMTFVSIYHALVASPYLRLAAIAVAVALLMKGAVAAGRMAGGSGGASAEQRKRTALAALFADEFAADAPGLLHKITTPAATRAHRTAALELDA